MKHYFRPFLAWKKQFRESLSEAQGHRCAYCLIDIFGKATIEHVWPRSKRGALIFENCVAACLPCNQQRGNGQIWDQYYRVREIRRARKAIPKFGVAA